MSLAFPAIAAPPPGAKMNLTDGRVRLRRFDAADIPQLYAAVRESMDELSAWLPWCYPGYSLEDSAKFIRTRDEEWLKDTHYSLAITDAVSDEFLGGVGLNFVNRAHNLANLGYWVRRRRTREGAATAAARLLARFGLEELKFTRIEIAAATGNRASQRVAEKAGAQREGVLRNGISLRGEPHDAVLFAFIPGDFERMDSL